jgi:hypothetical protein
MISAWKGEGNHGEDVKEYYFYFDSTPNHTGRSSPKSAG